MNSGIFAVLILLAVALTTCGRRHHLKKGTGLLVGESEDDIRDNVLNYDEQGGGEEDEVRLTCCQKLKGYVRVRLNFLPSQS